MFFSNCGKSGVPWRQSLSEIGLTVKRPLVMLMEADPGDGLSVEIARGIRQCGESPFFTQKGQ